MTEAHIEDVEAFAKRVIHYARNEHLRLNAAIDKALEEQQSEEANALCLHCGGKRSMHSGADERCIRAGYQGNHFEEAQEIVGITLVGPSGFPRSITYNGVRYVQDEVQP